jgi:hypothetical protein
MAAAVIRNAWKVAVESVGALHEHRIPRLASKKKSVVVHDIFAVADTW